MLRRFLIGSGVAAWVVLYSTASLAESKSPASCAACPPEVARTASSPTAGGAAAVTQFMSKLFDTTGFPPRWQCGTWTPLDGWLHIVSDLAIFGAYMAIPMVLLYFSMRRPDVPFYKTFWLFAAFIAACGTGHLVEAIIFWHPVYRFAGLLKLFTAVVSWGTVIALIPIVPKALALRSPAELERVNAALERQIEERQRLQAQLVDAARQAGQAEVATGVLHNVGNVLNSVNVSAHLLQEGLEDSQVETLRDASNAITQHRGDLPAFLTQHEQGKHFPQLLAELANHMWRQRDAQREELQSLTQSIDHINEIVSMQQSYALARDVLEPVILSDLLEDALTINGAGLNRHGVHVVRQYGDVPTILTDRHKLLQILINLISNAKYAVTASDRDPKQITLKLNANAGIAEIAVQDTGVGILRENMTRIFTHGFTTKKNGHGFGLHTSALAAQELGGAMSVHSDGLGCGATFTVRLPIEKDPSCAALSTTDFAAS